MFVLSSILELQIVFPAVVHVPLPGGVVVVVTADGGEGDRRGDQDQADVFLPAVLIEIALGLEKHLHDRSGYQNQNQQKQYCRLTCFKNFSE